MSFSGNVKMELAKVIPGTDHCQRAQAEARKYFTLIVKEYTIESGVLKRRCCKRAFLREAFLIAGTISDPSKSYHFEITCPSQTKAEFVRDLINSFDGMNAGIVLRKKSYVVYLKGSDRIVDMLGIMEASSAYMELENVRILKSMRNSVNRRVNCEAANISKTVSAAQRRMEDILTIRNTVGLQKLPPSLKEAAELRLAHPDISMTELGALFDPPTGKSGVNHRLRKLSEFARQLGES